jgi:hypothetical protein
VGLGVGCTSAFLSVRPTGGDVREPRLPYTRQQTYAMVSERPEIPDFDLRHGFDPVKENRNKGLSHVRTKCCCGRSYADDHAP